MNRWMQAGVTAATLLVAAQAAWALQAGPQKSGNELALSYAQATDKEKPGVVKESIGGTFFFRYLKVTKKVETTTNDFPCVIINSIEPSSDLYVSFKVVKKKSLELIRSINEGEAVAISGRVVAFQKDGEAVTIIIEPVIVRYKDKLAPKLGKELMEEVDPNAIKVPK